MLPQSAANICCERERRSKREDGEANGKTLRLKSRHLYLLCMRSRRSCPRELTQQTIDQASLRNKFETKLTNRSSPVNMEEVIPPPGWPHRRTICLDKATCESA